MHTIKQLQALIAGAVASKTFPAVPAELYEPIAYIMNLGGKRLRPALLLMACDAFGGDLNEALDPALGIELFHNFTLMHDDIMDQAPLRRGNATVHEKWNKNVAILSGDVMFVEAYKMLIKVRPQILPAVLQVFSDTAVMVCEGQQIDMNFETQDEVSMDDYLEMIRLKTAVLLGGALQIGALIAGADADSAALMYAFGQNLGTAFQLQDDILDVYGDPEKFGKQVGGDILSNKKTYLLIKALELAESHSELKGWLNTNTGDPKAKVEAVTAIYNRLNIKALAEAEMDRYAQKAMESFRMLPLTEDKKTTLNDFAGLLMARSF